MDLKVIEKSRKLLVQVMGQEDYDKFIEDGKIEIKHGEGKDEIVYELDQDARVYNRTKQESYCIEPISSSDLPVHDTLAIKYAYLKNNIKRVEEVANKRSTAPLETRSTAGWQCSSPGGLFDGLLGNLVTRLAGTGDTELQQETRQRRFGHTEVSHSPSYNSYVEYMENLGWRRTQITMDEHNARLATTCNVNANVHGQVIDVRCPAGQKITIMGTRQVCRGADVRTAHALRTRFADENDCDIPFDTRISITKERVTEDITQLARVFYGDISLIRQRNPINNDPLLLKTDNEWYRFINGVELNGEDHLRIYAIQPQVNIAAHNVRFALDCDLWSQ